MISHNLPLCLSCSGGTQAEQGKERQSNPILVSSASTSSLVVLVIRRYVFTSEPGR
jgi:hypothetical protein